MAQNYLTIKSVLDTFATNHDELKRFKVSFQEQLDNFVAEDGSFPILFSEILDLSFSESEDVYTYRIYCLDLLQKDRSNQDTILNTTSTILSDLTNWLRLNYEAPVVLLNSPRAIPVSNYLMDFTAGFYADFEFEVVGQKSDCLIPFTNQYIQFTGATCDVSYNKPWLTCATLPNCSYYIDLVNNSIVTNSLSATSISGGTFYSGSTPLSTIIQSFVTGGSSNSVFIQNGLNTYTGGTSTLPSVNVSAATLTSLSATTISGGTIYSGATALSNVIYNIVTANTSSTFLRPAYIGYGNSASGLTGDSTFLKTTGTYGEGKIYINNVLDVIGVYGGRLRVGTEGTGSIYTDTPGGIFYNSGYFNTSHLSKGTNDALYFTNDQNGAALGYMLYASTAANSLFVWNGIQKVNIISATTLSASTMQSSGMISTGSTRMVEATSGGTLSATREIISAYILNAATKALLEDVSNWDAIGNYTGSTISDTYQGQKHYNSNYLFEAVSDNVFIRLVRA